MNATGVTEEASPPGLATGAPIGGPHLGLFVRDPDAVSGWWCLTLGFVPADDAGVETDDDETGMPRAMVRHPDSGLMVGFRRRPDGRGRRDAGRISLRVASQNALDDWAAHLDELGVAHTEVRETGVELFLSLRGPDGIELELWWPRPC
jgi:glyoxylase I family protein